MQLVKLLLLHFGRGAHHDVLRVLVHRERDDLADGILAREEHDHAVHTRRNARVRGRAVAEGVVHGRELRLHVVLAETHQLKGLDHDLRVVVSHRAGGQLHAVAHKVVLVGVDVERIDLAALGFFEDLQTAVRHGERVVAELQLAGLLANLVHREVHDPAELVALLVHMAGHGGAQHLPQNARRLLRSGLFARRHADEAAGF